MAQYDIGIDLGTTTIIIAVEGRFINSGFQLRAQKFI